uniref:Uncharacterized protein n=1 Tax=Anguilla anguilla TaxID=7936 RepID=A0A0E9SGE8_ANGAN
MVGYLFIHIKTANGCVGCPADRPSKRYL